LGIGFHNFLCCAFVWSGEEKGEWNAGILLFGWEKGSHIFLGIGDDAFKFHGVDDGTMTHGNMKYGLDKKKIFNLGEMEFGCSRTKTFQYEKQKNSRIQFGWTMF